MGLESFFFRPEEEKKKQERNKVRGVFACKKEKKVKMDKSS
jgi:hypothetical protein